VKNFRIVIAPEEENTLAAQVVPFIAN
jgi:hypothetical protein